MKVILFFVFLCVSLFSPLFGYKYNKRKIIKEIKSIEQSENLFIGFHLYDPESDRNIATHNAERYMTPASNTKLYTFYTGITLLGDSVPAFRYTIKGDSLIFWGTGNPLLLHPEFDDKVLISFLKSRKEKLYYYQRPIKNKRFGPGWSWSDYNSYYSTEVSSFPIWGNNLTTFLQGNQITLTPRFFSPYVTQYRDDSFENVSVFRSEDTNLFILKGPESYLEESQVSYTPFRYSSSLFLELLSDEVGKPIQRYAFTPPVLEGKMVYSLPIDTLYRLMLQVSDNFLAEQILIMSSDKMDMTLSSRNVINYMNEHVFNNYDDSLLWVDGSGLSRYNMFTPRTTVRLLKEVRAKVGEERLFSLLPSGGVSGTLSRYYGGEDTPYVFAKTGTLKNNHCLSGYIKTKSGRTLIFSFMANHFPLSPTPVKKRLEVVLKKIYENY